VHRERTGQGQWIDLGMYQLGAMVIPEAFIAVQSGQPDVACRGNAEWGAAFSGVFPAAGEDQWVAVCASGADARAQLLHTLALPEDAGEAQLQGACRAWCRQRSAQAAAEQLQRAGVAAGVVNDASDLL